MKNKQPAIQISSPIKIWDLPVRLFHWSLVILVVLCFVSIKQGHITAHQYFGVTVFVLICFRIIWGFVGSSTARFSDFLHGPKTMLAYLKNQQSPTEGHNPLGAWMVIGLLAILLLQTLTGLFLEDNSYLYQDSPLAALIGSDKRKLFKQIHNLGEYILYAMIALHLLANLAYWVFKKQNLVKTIITGTRKIHELHPHNIHAHNLFQLRKDRPLLALAILIMLALLAYLAFFYPSSHTVFLGWFK